MIELLLLALKQGEPFTQDQQNYMIPWWLTLAIIGFCGLVISTLWLRVRDLQNEIKEANKAHVLAIKDIEKNKEQILKEKVEMVRRLEEEKMKLVLAQTDDAKRTALAVLENRGRHDELINQLKELKKITESLKFK